VVGGVFQRIDCICFHINREEVKLELLLKISPGSDRENTSVHFLTKYIFRPLGSTTSFEEHESPKNPFFFVVELLWGQCKGTPLSPPLNGMTTLWSYPSLLTSDT